MNLSRSREKEVAAKQTFTFPGTIPTKSEVRSTADAKRLDFVGVTKRKNWIYRNKEKGDM